MLSASSLEAKVFELERDIELQESLLGLNIGDEYEDKDKEGGPA